MHSSSCPRTHRPNSPASFGIAGTPIAASKSVGMTFAGAIDAVLSEAAIKLGKKLFPVRNPALGPGDGAAHAETDERGYVNTSWATMARYLGELPATDRGEVSGNARTRPNPSAPRISATTHNGVLRPPLQRERAGCRAAHQRPLGAAACAVACCSLYVCACVFLVCFC